MDKQDLITFEDTVKDMWEKGILKVPVHLSDGNEEQLIEIFKDIAPWDYVFSTHRNHYHYLLHGGDYVALLWEIMGYPGGICGGNSGSMHTIDPKCKFYSSGIVAGMVAIACGVALGIKRNKGKEQVWCFVGDGACDSGHTWEAWRYAVGHDLPITYVVEDNNRSVCAPRQARWGAADGELRDMPKMRYYTYKAKYPHVGSGKYVNF